MESFSNHRANHTAVRSKSCEESSVQSIDRLGRRVGGGGDMRDELAEISSPSFLQEALVKSSGMGGKRRGLKVSS